MLFGGDDWAEDHHDIEIAEEAGQRLARQGLTGISRLQSMIAACMPAEWAELPEGEAAGRVKVGIETERGQWVQALVAAGYERQRRVWRRPARDAEGHHATCVMAFHAGRREARS
jgi:hypothetical protein